MFKVRVSVTGSVRFRVRLRVRLGLVLRLRLDLGLCFMITGYWSGLLVMVRFRVRLRC